MWETICNKNTVQDGHGKQETQQERQDTLDDDRYTLPASKEIAANVHSEVLPYGVN